QKWTPGSRRLLGGRSRPTPKSTNGRHRSPHKILPLENHPDRFSHLADSYPANETRTVLAHSPCSIHRRRPSGYVTPARRRLLAKPHTSTSPRERSARSYPSTPLPLLSVPGFRL